MKKLILLFVLFCGTISGQTTYNDVSNLINSNLASGIKIQANKHREVEHALLNFANQNSSQQFDIKAIYVNSTYLGNNFETSGLGKNLRLGWAICNGNNGTPNMGGRSIVAYGGDFTTLNAVGGSKDAILVTHDHKAVSSVNPSGEFSATNKHLAAYRTNGGNTEYGLQGTATVPTTGVTTVEGESGSNKNMHPYIVLVYIMKL
jgi:hypothetical protein